MASYERLEKRLADIRQIVNDGAKNAEVVAEEIGLRPGTIRNYMSTHGIRFTWQKRKVYHKKKEESIEAIKNAIEAGVKNADEIASLTGLATTTIMDYVSKYNIDFPRIRQRIKKYPELIREAAAKAKKEDILSVYRSIARHLDLSLATIIGYARFEKLPVPEEYRGRNIYTRDPKIDVLVQRGEILRVIGLAYSPKSSRPIEVGRQYVLSTDQKKKWVLAKLQKKCEEQERVRTLGCVVSALENRVAQLAQEEGFPAEKAFEYKHLFPGTSCTIEMLIGLFARYKTSQDTGTRLSLAKLGEPDNLYPTTVKRILNRVGLYSLNKPNRSW